MSVMFPFLTSYDPPGTSEGSLDPLALYQIADQLAIQLVPAVRERMQRIRFLTAMAVGAIVTEDCADDSRQQDASPYLVWEWLVVESLVREMGNDHGVWGVPGSSVTKRALDQHGYLDAKSYLKTPRIFGFHGVYKRLAMHLGLADVHLGPGPNAEALVDAWAKDQGFGGIEGAKPTLSRWSAAVRRGLNEKSPRTKPGWNKAAWAELAGAFAPAVSKPREKRRLKEMLNAADDRRLGALSTIWKLQDKFDDETFQEELLHDRLEQREPAYRQLLQAIRAYEAFARSLQDAFDLLKSEAARSDVQGFAVREIRRDAEFQHSVKGLNERFNAAHRALGEVGVISTSLQSLFAKRFERFSEPMDAGACALELCVHHEIVQRSKSADGKRPWFDRLDKDRIYIRHAYREPRRDIQPASYLHDYRGWPIRRFYADLS